MTACSANIPHNLSLIGIGSVCFGDKYTKKLPIYQSLVRDVENVKYFALVNSNTYMRVIPNIKRRGWQIYEPNPREFGLGKRKLVPYDKIISEKK